MRICRTISEMRAFSREKRPLGSLAVVPTMGALHAGHAALAGAAVKDHPFVVATIFVNPTQFGNPDDLENYPRTEEADLALLEQAGVSAVFIPRADAIYPDDDETIVETTSLANRYHGKVRPGHFRGVTTVVSKLFHITEADFAYFGEKDYQQLSVIRRMVRDLHFAIQIVGVPTVRADDGLALSSRNVRLTDTHRAAAPIMHRSLMAAEAAFKSGETVEAATQDIEALFAAEDLADLKAVDVVYADTFQPASGRPAKKIGIMISALFGEVLLIDQKEVSP